MFHTSDEETFFFNSLWYDFFPPANVVCEGYVFTPVCDSVDGGRHVWLGGMYGQGVCVLGGGMHGKGGRAWQRGACMMKGGMHGKGGGACMANGGMHGERGA